MKFEEFLNESKLNEMTINYFEPTVLSKSDSINPKLFKKLLPKSANTSKEAEERIFDFDGNTMFVHYQYFLVKPHGNAPDRPTYRIHNSQYWLNDYQLKMQGKKDVNVTLLSFYDITDKDNEKSLGAAWVSTDVYLKEMPVVFEILKRNS
jgi:hypothetical protein